MNALTVTLAGLPPSTNHRYARGQGGSLHLNRETAAWQIQAAQIIRNAAIHQAWAAPPKAPLVFTVRFTTPKLYTRDGDNMLKSLVDATAAALDFNDAYIVRFVVDKERGPADETRVTLEAAPSLQALIARRMESYVPPVEGELAFREACTAAKITPIPAHPNGLTNAQAAAVLACLAEGGRRVWAHEVGEGP